MHMEIPDYIAIVSIGISIGGGIYAAVTNTKKYELAEQYKRELLKWYEKTISIIMELIAKRQNSDRDLLLAKLSAQIESKRSIASTFHHLCPSAIIVSYYTQSKKFSTRLF